MGWYRGPLIEPDAEAAAGRPGGARIVVAGVDEGQGVERLGRHGWGSLR